MTKPWQQKWIRERRTEQCCLVWLSFLRVKIVSHIRFCFSLEFFSEYGSKHMAKRLRASCDDWENETQRKKAQNSDSNRGGRKWKGALWGLLKVSASCQRSAMSAPHTDCGLAIEGRMSEREDSEGFYSLQIRKVFPRKELGGGYQKASMGESALVSRITSYWEKHQVCKFYFRDCIWLTGLLSIYPLPKEHIFNTNGPFQK